MRIAMVGPFGLGPKQTMRSRALGLARPLVARGHAVRLFMPPWHTPEEAGRTWEEEGGVALRYVALAGGTLGITRRLVRETLDWQPDVVHAFKPKAYSGLVAAWLWQFHRRRVRVVVDTDDWEGWGGWNDREPYSRPQKHFFAWQERHGMTHNHALTVASRALESIAREMDIPPTRVVYVPNGPGIPDREVSAAVRAGRRERLGLGERPTLLLYSRLFEFDTARLLAVLRGVRAAVPDLAVLSVGAGLFAGDSAALRAGLAGAGLAEAVVELGWVEPDELPEVLAAADVGLYLMDDVLLNRTKCPVKLVDMLLAGVPVVGEAVGQVPETVRDGETGLVRPSGDVEGLVAAAARLLGDPAGRARMGAAARADVRERFNWDALAERLLPAYGLSSGRGT